MPPAMYAELCSAYAVASAGQGLMERARQLAEIGEHHRIAPDARIGAACARAIAALRNSDYDEGCREAQVALAHSIRAGSIEPFVTAYRGCPEIVVSLFTDPRIALPTLRDVLTLAGDAALAGRQALPDRSVLALSRREKEVLALIARGLRTARSGETLFISPVTGQSPRQAYLRKARRKVKGRGCDACGSVASVTHATTADCLQTSVADPVGKVEVRRLDPIDIARPQSRESPRTPPPPRCRTAIRQPVRDAFAPPGLASLPGRDGRRSSRCMRRPRR